MPSMKGAVSYWSSPWLPSARRRQLPMAGKKEERVTLKPGASETVSFGAIVPSLVKYVILAESQTRSGSGELPWYTACVWKFQQRLV